MALPKQPVTLSPEQVELLNRQLSTLRHDINNQLSLIVAAMELLRHKPDLSERMLTTVAEQPAKIGESIKKFTGEFESALQITRP